MENNLTKEAVVGRVQLHELTEKLNSGGYKTIEEENEIITTWLRERAKELATSAEKVSAFIMDRPDWWTKNFETILGLTPKEEKVSVEHCLVHDDYWKQDKNNNFCNYCGAKRPEPREKELFEVIKYADGAWGVGRYYPPICDEYAKFVSNYALDWFIELVEKQPLEFKTKTRERIILFDSIIKELRGLKK